MAYLTSQAGTQSQPARPEQVAKKETPREIVPTSREELKSAFVLQVVFVVDTTRSLQPWIESMKLVISRISESLENDPALKGRVELAVICYRDELDPASSEETRKQMEYVTKRVSDLCKRLPIVLMSTN